MLGLKPGRPWAYLARGSEFGGCVLAALGLAHPVGPVSVIGSMAIILGGPGKWSLDRALGIQLPAWIAPLGLAIVILTLIYAERASDMPQDQDEAREELAGEE